MDGREKAAVNEEIILSIINRQRWIREDELSLLAGMSLAMTRRACVRLAEYNFIYRDKSANGIFLRLKVAGARKIGGRSGKGVELPNTWQHDCLSVQGLHYLKQAFSDDVSLTIDTEAQLRRRQQTGKIADGTLQPTHDLFQMEYGRKTGDAMRSQARETTLQAKCGRRCIVGYPYPPEFCGKSDDEHIDHEYRQTVAMRREWGDAEAPNILLLRCIVGSRVDFLKGRARAFELIDLPPMPANARIHSRRTVDEVMGYRWDQQEIRNIHLREHRIVSTLLYQELPTDWVLEFTESQSEDEPHRGELDGEYYHSRDDESFADFVLRIQHQTLKTQKQINAEDGGYCRG